MPLSPSTVTPSQTFPAIGLGRAARLASVQLTLGSGGPPVIEINLNTLPPGQAFTKIGAVVVDNTAGALPVTVSFPDTGAAFTIAQGDIDTFPGLTGGLVLRLAYAAASAPATLYNVLVTMCTEPLPSLPLPGLGARPVAVVGEIATPTGALVSLVAGQVVPIWVPQTTPGVRGMAFQNYTGGLVWVDWSGGPPGPNTGGSFQYASPSIFSPPGGIIPTVIVRLYAVNSGNVAAVMWN